MLVTEVFMIRSAKRRRKALAKQARESRKQIQSLLESGERKPLQRFALRDGVVSGGNVLYSDEESE